MKSTITIHMDKMIAISEHLPQKNKGELFDALVRYQTTGKKIQTEDKTTKLAFEILKQSIDHNNEAYRVSKEKRVQKAKKAAAVRYGYSTIPEHTKGCLTETETETETDNDTANETDTDIDIDVSPSPSPSSSSLSSLSSGRKGKDTDDSELKIKCKEVLRYLNESTGKQFKFIDSNLSYIRARLCEGYRIDELEDVIKDKVLSWGEDPEMRCYLRPSTLFSSKNFDSYLTAAVDNKNRTVKGVVKGGRPVMSDPTEFCKHISAEEMAKYESYIGASSRSRSTEYESEEEEMVKINMEVNGND